MPDKNLTSKELQQTLFAMNPSDQSVRALRNNNPGNLVFNNQDNAVPEEVSNKFAQFNTFYDGYQALLNDIQLKKEGKSKFVKPEDTLRDLIYTWAPPTENQSNEYLKFITSETGLSANTPIEKINPRDIAPLIARMEGVPKDFINEFSTLERELNDRNETGLSEAEVIQEAQDFNQEFLDSPEFQEALATADDTIENPAPTPEEEVEKEIAETDTRPEQQIFLDPQEAQLYNRQQYNVLSQQISPRQREQQPTQQQEEQNTNLEPLEIQTPELISYNQLLDNIKQITQPQVMQEGGKIDPPQDNITQGQNFVRNWINNPITRSRLDQQIGYREYGPSQDNSLFPRATSQINNAMVNVYQGNPQSSMGAEYSPMMNIIDFYGEPSQEVAAHEYTHATGIDVPMSQRLVQQYGNPLDALVAKHNTTGDNRYNEAITKEFGEDLSPQGRRNVFNHSTYLKNPNGGELYPKVMEIRNILNMSPGQQINQNDIQKIKETNQDLNDSFMRFYTDEQILDMVNNLATTQTNTTNTTV